MVIKASDGEGKYHADVSHNHDKVTNHEPDVSNTVNKNDENVVTHLNSRENSSSCESEADQTDMMIEDNYGNVEAHADFTTVPVLVVHDNVANTKNEKKKCQFYTNQLFTRKLFIK